MKKGSRRSWISIGVMALLLGWTAYTILRAQTPRQLAEAFAAANRPVLLLGIPVMMLYIGFEACSTWNVLRALGTPQPLRRCCFYSCTGFFFSTVTPSATGGQPAQVWYMSRKGVPAASGAIAMLMTTIGYNSAVVLYGVLAIGGGAARALGAGVGVLLGMGFGVLLALIAGLLAVLFLPGPAGRLCLWAIGLAARLRPRLDRAALEEKLERQMTLYRQGAALIRETRWLLPAVLLLGAGQLACTFAVPCIVYRAFGLSGAGLWKIFSLQALCAISVNFLPLPGAAGAAEQVFLRGFAAVFGAGLTAPAMILTRTVNCYLILAVTGIITAVGHGVSGRKIGRNEKTP